MALALRARILAEGEGSGDRIKTHHTGHILALRARVEARAQELIEEELTLRDLRQAAHLTQERIAELLGVAQENVSRLERRADLLLSTLSSYVAALGGRLRLVAEFPNRRPVTVTLGDLSDNKPSEPRRRTRGVKSYTTTR